MLAFPFFSSCLSFPFAVKLKTSPFIQGLQYVMVRSEFEHDVPWNIVPYQRNVPRFNF